MSDNDRVFCVLTLLVAVTEQAMMELATLDAPPRELLADLDRTHDAAVVLAHRLAGHGDERAA